MQGKGFGYLNRKIDAKKININEATRALNTNLETGSISIFDASNFERTLISKEDCIKLVTNPNETEQTLTNRYVIGIGDDRTIFEEHSNEIAEYYSDGWHYTTPERGWEIYLTEEDRDIVFNGYEWVEKEQFIDLADRYLQFDTMYSANREYLIANSTTRNATELGFWDNENLTSEDEYKICRRLWNDSESKWDLEPVGLQLAGHTPYEVYTEDAKNMTFKTLYLNNTEKTRPKYCPEFEDPLYGEDNVKTNGTYSVGVFYDVSFKYDDNGTTRHIQSFLFPYANKSSMWSSKTSLKVPVSGINIEPEFDSSDTTKEYGYRIKHFPGQPELDALTWDFILNRYGAVGGVSTSSGKIWDTLRDSLYYIQDKTSVNEDGNFYTHVFAEIQSSQLPIDNVEKITDTKYPYITSSNFLGVEVNEIIVYAQYRYASRSTDTIYDFIRPPYVFWDIYYPFKRIETPDGTMDMDSILINANEYYDDFPTGDIYSGAFYLAGGYETVDIYSFGVKLSDDADIKNRITYDQLFGYSGNDNRFNSSSGIMETSKTDAGRHKIAITGVTTTLYGYEVETKPIVEEEVSISSYAELRKKLSVKLGGDVSAEEGTFFDYYEKIRIYFYDYQAAMYRRYCELTLVDNLADMNNELEEYSLANVTAETTFLDWGLASNTYYLNVFFYNKLTEGERLSTMDAYPPQKARYLMNYYNHLFYVDYDEPYFLRFSNTGEPDEYPPNNKLDFDSEIRGMAVVGEKLMVLTNDAIYNIYGGNPTNFNKHKLYELENMSIMKNTAISVENLLYFVIENSGVYATDGNSLEYLSAKYANENEFIDNTDADYEYHLLNHKRAKYLMFVTDINGEAKVLHTKNGGWFDIDLYDRSEFFIWKSKAIDFGTDKPKIIETISVELEGTPNDTSKPAMEINIYDNTGELVSDAITIQPDENGRRTNIERYLSTYLSESFMFYIKVYNGVTLHNLSIDKVAIYNIHLY